VSANHACTHILRKREKRKIKKNSNELHSRTAGPAGDATMVPSCDTKGESGFLWNGNKIDNET